MSLVEGFKSAHLERRKRLWRDPPPIVRLPPLPLDMAGEGTARMWCGVDLSWFRIDEARTADSIIAAVIHETGVTYRDLMGPWRTKKIGRARQIIYYLMRHHTKLSLPAIGRRMGDRHHSTVLSGIRCVNHHCRLFEPHLSNVRFRLSLGPPRELIINSTLNMC